MLVNQAWPCKVGISFPVSEPALSACVEINRAVAQLAQTIVTFGPEGTSKAHVTVAMGVVTKEKFPGLTDDVRKLATELAATVDLSFGKAYREDVTGRYVCCDVTLAPPDARGWLLQARARLAKFFLEPSRTSEKPHLTLARIQENISMVDSFLHEAQQVPPCTVTSIDVARCGSSGRKLEVLEQVPLG